MAYTKEDFMKHLPIDAYGIMATVRADGMPEARCIEFQFEEDNKYFNSKQVAMPRNEMYGNGLRKSSTITNRNSLEELNKMIPETRDSIYRNNGYTTAQRKITTGKKFSDLM